MMDCLVYATSRYRTASGDTGVRRIFRIEASLKKGNLPACCRLYRSKTRAERMQLHGQSACWESTIVWRLSRGFPAFSIGRQLLHTTRLLCLLQFSSQISRLETFWWVRLWCTGNTRVSTSKILFAGTIINCNQMAESTVLPEGPGSLLTNTYILVCLILYTMRFPNAR